MNIVQSFKFRRDDTKIIIIYMILPPPFASLSAGKVSEMYALCKSLYEFVMDIFASNKITKKTPNF